MTPVLAAAPRRERKRLEMEEMAHRADALQAENDSLRGLLVVRDREIQVRPQSFQAATESQLPGCLVLSGMSSCCSGTGLHTQYRT